MEKTDTLTSSESIAPPLEEQGTEVARQSVRSTFLLFLGNIGSTLIVAVASLIIARLLAPANYGEYSLALVTPSIFQLIVSFGANSAVIRYAAYHVSRGEIDLAKRATKNGMLFTLLSGVVLALANYLSAGLFASSIFHRPSLTPYIQVASLVVLAQSLFLYSYSSFIGWKWPANASLSSIIQSSTKLTLSPILILTGLGVAGAVYAQIASYVVAGGFGATSIFLYKLRKFQVEDPLANQGGSSSSSSSSFSFFFQDVKKMLSYGLPVYAGNFVSMLSQQWFVVIILSAIASNEIVGYYQASLNVTTSITLLSSSLAYALFPAFAELDGTRGDTHLAFSYAIKYISYFLTPMVFFLIGASTTIVEILYGVVYLPASYFLDLLAIAALPLALGLTVIPPFFNGLGKTRFTMYMYLAGALAIFTLGPLFGEVLKLGPQGILFSLIISNLVASLMGVFLARKYLGARIDYASGARIFFAADVCYIVLYFISELSSLPHVALLVLELLIYFGLYLTISPIIRVIDRSDLGRLRISSEGSGLLSRIIHPILKYETLLIEKTTQSQVAEKKGGEDKVKGSSNNGGRESKEENQSS